MVNNKEEEVIKDEVYVKNEIGSKAKFFIKEVPNKIPAPYTQTFQEKLKTKGFGLKLSLNQTGIAPNPYNHFNTVDQDKKNTASPIFSVIL